MFSNVNSWLSKKPCQYWRSFSPKDIPLDNDKPIYYYEWDNLNKKWCYKILSPIKRHWSIDNIRAMISIHNKLLELGRRDLVIVEVHPKYRIGNYKNVKINKVFNEVYLYNINTKFYSFYDTMYNISYKKNIYTVTEKELNNIIENTMEEKSNKTPYCQHIFSDDNKNIIHINSLYFNKKNELQYINNVFSNDIIKFFDSENNQNVEYTTNFKYVKTVSLPKKVWKNINHNKFSIETVSEDNYNHHLHITFANFKKYCKGQSSSKLKSFKKDIILRKDIILKDEQEISYTFNTISKKLKKIKKIIHSKEKHEKIVVIYYEDIFEKQGFKTIKTTITDKHNNTHPIYKKIPNLVKVPKKRIVICDKWIGEKLAEKYDNVKLLTLLEFNKKKDPIINTIGSKKDPKAPKLVRKQRRNSIYGKPKKINRHVKIQTIELAKSTDDDNFVEPIITDLSHKDRNSQVINREYKKPIKFITPSTIIGSKIIHNGKIEPKCSTKRIFHYDQKDIKRSLTKNITKHNIKKRSQRVPKEQKEKIISLKNKFNTKQDISLSLTELKKRYSSYDRRYTINSEVENWSLQFFIVLKMVKDKERSKKVLKYLINNCKFSEEFAIGFIKYLQLTRNGDPEIEHKKSTFKRTMKVMRDKAQIKFDSPSIKEFVTIEHDVEDKENGGIKTIITPMVFSEYVKTKKHRYLGFFKYSNVKDEKILIAKSKDVRKWAYDNEYDAEKPENTKWHDLVYFTTIQVPEVVKTFRRLPRKVKGTNREWVKEKQGKNKWRAPIPNEKAVKYIVKKLLTMYNSGDHNLLYSFIRNKIIEEYNNGTVLYDDIRYALYHNYSDLCKSIAILIKENKMDDKDLVIFMEDITHPHFN